MKQLEEWEDNTNLAPEYISVIIVGGIIIGEFYIYMFIFMKSQISENVLINIILFTYLMIFIILYILLLISYNKVYRCSPGYSPPFINEIYENQLEEFKENSNIELKKKIEYKKKQRNKLLRKYKQDEFSAVDEDNESKEIFQDYNNSNQEEEKNTLPWNLENITYCFICQKIKMPRQHHCKKCQRCILRMDHHCTWVGNCIGLRNHKYFILFEFYATFCLALCTLHIALAYLFNGDTLLKEFSHLEIILITLCSASSLALSFSLGFLLIFHLKCVSQNITTVESHIEEMNAKFNPFLKKDFQTNMQDIFGSNKSTWLFPVEPFPSSFGLSAQDYLPQKEEEEKNLQQIY